MKKKSYYFENWQIFCNYSFLYLISGVFLMALFQIAVIIAYGELELLKEFSKVARSFWFGARASGKIFAVALSPIFLCGFFFSLLPFPFFLRFASRLLPVAGFCFLIFSFLISLVNFYYYRFYGNPIDILIFEGQKESLTDLYYYIQGGVSFWEFFLVLGLGGFLIYWLNRKLVLLSQFYWKIEKLFGKGVYLVASLLLLVVVARGTLHPSVVFKIARDEKATNNILLNNAAINGISALYVAYVHKQLQQKQWENFSAISDEQALAAFKILYPEQKITLQTLQQKLYQSNATSPTLSQKPHIVFALMEGWGAYQMRFHNSNTLNLLGDLEKHLKEDYYFENLFAIAGHTYAALQFLFVDFWGFNLIDANYQKKINSNVKLLKKLGYRTIFITSGKKSWHRLEDYTKDFGFDETYGWYDILEKYPDAPANFYGGFDHTAFEFALEKLQAESQEPLFLFILTTSNHTPYFIPPNYQPFPIVEIPPKMQKVIETDKKKTQKIITTYQYSNHSLGEFVTKIKANQILKENTVVVAVGDHYARRLFNQSKDETVLYGKSLVPAYFYFPNSYRKQIFFDAQRLGSQGDIFPTLWKNLFPDTNYFTSGNNLLAQNYPRNLAISRNSVMSEFGYVSENTYYRWENDLLGDLQRLEKPTAELLQTKKIQTAYNQFLDWHFFQK